MQLPAVPPASWEDLTLNFDTLQSVLSKPSAQALAFLQLASAANRKLAFGSVTITFSANTNASTTVTHGLGTTPVIAVMTLAQSPGSSMVTPWVTSLGASTFVAEATLSAAATGGVLFYWVAIG